MSSISSRFMFTINRADFVTSVVGDSGAADGDVGSLGSAAKDPICLPSNPSVETVCVCVVVLRVLTMGQSSLFVLSLTFECRLDARYTRLVNGEVRERSH